MLAVAIQVAGPIAALLPAVALGGFLLLRYPAFAMGLLMFSAVAFEAHDPGILPPIHRFYEPVGASLTPSDLLLFTGLAGVALASLREAVQPRLPAPLTIPLLLLALALVAGVVAGHYAVPAVGWGDLFGRSLKPLYIILIPLLAVNVMRDTRTLHVFAAVAAALAAYKGLSGTYAALGGIGEAANETTISFLDPLANLVMVAFLLGVVAALIRRVKLPGWMYVSAPLAMLALLLSYRRSFWVAGLFALVIVVIVASRRRGRAMAALAGVFVALTLIATYGLGASDQSQSPLLERAGSLSPTGLESNRGDRYRVDEQRNVIANLKEHPLTGLGVGVPWSIHHPTAEAHDRRYAHVGILWYWLSFGLLGVLAYVAVMGGGLWTAATVWRKHPDSFVQISAIAAFGTILALLVVELTATFAGIETRTSLLLGGLLGWIAAAWRDIPKNRIEVPRPGYLPGP